MKVQVTDYSNVISVIWPAVDVSGHGAAYLASVADLRPELVRLHAAHLAQSEICNGGFDQFFHNAAGVLAPEAVEGFRDCGMAEAAQVIEAAVRLFGCPYPRYFEPRHRLMGTIDRAHLGKLDERFYAVIESEAGGFQRAADRRAAEL